jgi:peroxiredoxin
MENNNDWVKDRLGALSPDNEWTPDINRGLARLRDRTTAGRREAHSWKLSLPWSAAAGIACLGLLAAFPAPRAAAQYCLNCSVALWQNLATSKVVHINLIPESTRRPAFDFILNDASGRPVQLSAFKGKVVLLNFWATWCGACKVEIPWFMGFEQTYAGRGFQVLGVSMDEDGWKVVKPYSAAKRVNYPVMIGDSNVASFSVEALPVSFLIDRLGRVASMHPGLVSKSDYQAAIEKLLTE